MRRHEVKRAHQNTEGLARPHQSVRVRPCLISAATLMLAMLASIPCSWGTGLVELVGGGAWSTGGALENEQGYGAQLTLGWGGRPDSMKQGSAIYGYGALSFDRTSQIGPLSLGEPELDHTQLALTGGVRFYQQTGERIRLWMDVGAGYSFGESATRVVGINTVLTNVTTPVITVSAGLQWRLKSELLLSLGYYQAIFTEPDQIKRAERSLLLDGEGESFGRGRVAIGLGWIL